MLLPFLLLGSMSCVNNSLRCAEGYEGYEGDGINAYLGSRGRSAAARGARKSMC